MKLLFTKNLNLVDVEGKSYDYQRMKAYEIPDSYALQIIEQGYACKFGFLNELEVSNEIYTPEQIKEAQAQSGRPEVPFYSYINGKMEFQGYYSFEKGAILTPLIEDDDEYLRLGEIIAKEDAARPRERFANNLEAEGSCICDLCNIDTGEYYMLPNAQWFDFVPEEHQDKNLCMNCYNSFRQSKGQAALNYDDWEIITKVPINQEDYKECEQ